MSTFLGMPTAPRGVGHLRGTEPFPVAARRALGDAQLRRNLGKATSHIRAKRAAVVAELPDWEELRAAGQAIKARTMADLGRYLEQLEAAVTVGGGIVHWARDANEANAVVTRLVLGTGATEAVKVKSMVTDEIGLNDALAAAGITAHETDLAELIVQLGQDRPSHILVPAIHRNRAEIRAIFLREMGDVDPDLTDEPAALAEAARRHLRRKFLTATVGISGANFAIAETGTLCVVESEGNGRMCLTLPRTLITVMGIEKVIPTWADLGVFLQLLPRSSTGERMNPYTSMWTGVTPGDGPQAFHLVLLDNGRTAALADPMGREALHCIRCSACMNVCPVYERTGGHAYGSVYPGPIGAVLSPQLTGIEDNSSLPYASSLCGACYDACPVKINIPQLLVHLRARHVEEARAAHRLPSAEAVTMAAASWVMATPRRFALAQRAAQPGRLLGRRGRITALPPPLAAWTTARDAPAPPRQTFRDWWRTEHADPHSGRIRNERARRGTGEDPGCGARQSAPVTEVASVSYRERGQLATPALLELLADRLTDYRAAVRRATGPVLAATVAAALAERGARQLVVPPGLDLPLPEWAQVTIDDGLSAAELDSFDAVVTRAAVAIAETGTIILDGSPGQGRRAISLVPDYHLCIVKAGQVVGLVPEAITSLAGTGTRPLTWISGPSATSDIELERVEGVHGPRTLEVILVTR